MQINKRSTIHIYVLGSLSSRDLYSCSDQCNSSGKLRSFLVSSYLAPWQTHYSDQSLFATRARESTHSALHDAAGEMHGSVTCDGLLTCACACLQISSGSKFCYGTAFALFYSFRTYKGSERRIGDVFRQLQGRRSEHSGPQQVRIY